MGTRSLTIFSEDGGFEIGVLYRQMDGYPEGHGMELAKLLWVQFFWGHGNLL